MYTLALPVRTAAITTPLLRISRWTPHHHPSSHLGVHTVCGTPLTLRAVQPQDAQALAALVARLSPNARRNRFHGAAQVSVNDARRMCRIDAPREVAFVITAPQNGVECVVADARYCIDRQSDAGADKSADKSSDTSAAKSAEFAVMVDERWQRRGLGTWAMAALTDAAQTAGLHWLHGEVLSTNLPMLGLMRCCGLCCTPDAEDDGLVQVQERLGLGESFSTHPQPRTAMQQLQHWITR